MARRSSALALLLLAVLGTACTDAGSGPGSGSSDVSLASRDAVDLPTPDAAPVPASLPEDIEVVGLDEVEPVPLADLGAWVDRGVSEDAWTEAEGLAQALRYVTGETPAADLAGAAEVATPGVTGLVRRAADLLGAEEPEGPVADELRRLVRVFSPATADLEAASVPRDEADAEGGEDAATSMPLAMGAGSAPVLAAEDTGTPSSCEDLAAVGFVEVGGLDDACLVYDEEVVDGHPQRVYYPRAWRSDDSKQQAITAAMEALVDSAEQYGQYGRYEAASLVFSLLPSPLEDSEATVPYFDADDTCPVTVFRSAGHGGVPAFKQIIAHEAFHCFQTWNYDGEPYAPHAWWLEGSAEYFSNVVYPQVDAEHTWTAAFDQRSLTGPLWEMEYENVVFFQHLANNMGDEAVLDTLEAVDATGGGSASAGALDDVPDMRTIFNELVVSFLSEGIADTGGARFEVATPTALRRAITAEEEYDFDTRPFVATRWTLDYEQEHRFVQAHQDGGALHGFVEAEQRRDRSAWTLLPEELRSSCTDDDRNWLVATTVDDERTFTIDVTEKEEGVCDPCLLGAWAMQLEDFEAAMRNVIANAPGGMPPGAAGATVEVPGGGYYFEFEDDGGMRSQRNGLQVRVGSAAGAITFTIDGHGTGQYDADGEVMTVTDMVQQASHVRGVLPNGFTIDQTPDSSTFNFFGNSTTVGVGSGEARPEDQSAPYTCDEDLLSIDAEMATIDFDRIDKIPEPEALEDTDPS